MMMKDSRSLSWRSKSVEGSTSFRKEDFGNVESVGGVAGDSSIGLSEEIGANHSTTGSASVPKRRDFSRPDISYYEDDSVMLWSDDPEREYFEYMLQQEQEHRARQGKSAEDSLIGESTVEEIQMQASQWHQNGGQDSCEDGNQTLDMSFPILSTYNKGGANSSFGGYSLATTEKSKQDPQPRTEADPAPKGEGGVFPNIIYVGDGSSAPAASSKDSSKASGSEMRRGRCFYVIVFFLGGLCLAGTAVAVYLSITTKGGKSSNTAASIQGDFGTTSPTTSQPNTTSLRPTSTFATMAPSSLLQKKTPEPTTTSGGVGEATAAPVATPGPTESPTEAPTDPVTREPSQTAVPEISSSPAPTKEPTAAPTREPSQLITTETPPTTAPATSTTLRCGCTHCSLAWDRLADDHSCGDRISFLIFQRGYSEIGACRLVAGVEFPTVCGLCDPEVCNLGNAATAPPSFSPTRLPIAVAANEAPSSPRPSLRTTTARPTSLDLTVAGNDGEPTDTFPLGRCEGDCDSDADCAEGLVCYGRDAGDPVPGCLDGDQDMSRTDYCIPDVLSPQPTQESTFRTTPLPGSISVINSRNAGDDFFP